LVSSPSPTTTRRNTKKNQASSVSTSSTRSSTPNVGTAGTAAVLFDNNDGYYESNNNDIDAGTELGTAEKRAKRLERNRESARKSRARRKERLSALSIQVDKLHTKLEHERRYRVHNEMITELNRCRHEGLSQLDEAMKDEYTYHNLVTIIRNTSASAYIMVSDFQYNTLRQLILPRHIRFLLWLTMQNDQFFSTGKEEYVQRREENIPKGSTGKGGKGKPKALIGRVSSKQVGEDVTKRAMKALMKNTPDAAYLMGPSCPSNSNGETNVVGVSGGGGGGGNGGNVTSLAHDPHRMWPLFAYEIQFSVENEDRILTARRTLLQQTLTPQQLASGRARALAADNTVESVRRAMESLCRVISQREERSFLGTMEVHQVCAYQKWLTTHRLRCRHAYPPELSRCTSLERIPSENITSSPMDVTSNSRSLSPVDSYSVTLTELCRKLQEMFKS
jgi:hypothetical protein